MAAGTGANFKIYQEYFRSRVNELLAQNGIAFNAASNGAIRLTTQSLLGDYHYQSFFANLGSGLAARRDVTSVGAQTDTPMTQNELISVKLNRKLIPIAQTRDAFRKIFGRFDENTFTGLVAEQSANAMQLEMLNTTLAALTAALRGQTTSSITESSLGSVSTNALVTALAGLGDQASRIVCWLMHSKPYYDLVKSQITSNITGISNFNIAQASPVTLNRPVVVSDSSGLILNPTSPDFNQYVTLGLVADAGVIENSEEQEVVVQDVTGQENLIVRIQGEYAYNLGLKGFQWDTANGGTNPTATALATGTNWDPVFGNVKDRAGVALLTL
jgi:hypothetical protein